MSVVLDAQNLLGKVRYQFGADNITGGVGDCSSFTQYVFKQNGVNIGRDTETQWTGNTGKKVSRDDLQAGDLVFFRNTYNSGHTDGVSHVGIYIGDGLFIHNSSSKGVTTNSLDETYYKQHYLGAKRVKGATSGSTPSTGGTINPTYSGEEVHETNEDSNLDVIGQIVKFILIIGLIIVALVFFFNAFGVSATDTIKKKVVKV